MRLCYQRLWVNLQKSFYDANRTRHCWEIYLPQTSLSEVDTSPQKRHRWRCRLIPSVLGAPGATSSLIPVQTRTDSMRYNAGDGSVQLSVNLISRLEEGRPITVLEIWVNPKKNAPKVLKAPKFEFWNFLLILKIFLKLNDVQLRKLSICKNLLNNESDF